MFLNRTLLAGLATGLAIGCSPAVFAQANVDLNNWSEITNNANGFWDVDDNNVEGSGPNGTFVRQEINGAPTIFLSPNNFINTEINGSFSVRDTSLGDDDFIGFVFGVNNPSSSTIDALLFDWKRGPQSGALEGFRLSYVTGDLNNSVSVNNPFWTHTSTTSTTSGTTFQSLGTNYDSSYGWNNDATEYGFNLDYSTSNITINVTGGQFGAAGLEVFNVNAADVPGIFPGGAFPDGQFGFYNFSQALVTYESFTRTDDPVLATTPADGGTLDFGNVRVTGSSTQSVQVANGGGPGSSLSGTAPTPTDTAFSIDTAPGSFLLGESEDTTFDYSFSPATRGAFSETVNFASNDPVDTDGHDVTLSGQGVGPEYQASETSLDFGNVDANAMASLFLTLTNTTSDGDLGALTDLTLNGISIGGTDADLFSLVAFVPGTEIAAGSNYMLELKYTGDGSVGLLDAFLLIQTDEGALLAGDGTDYQLSISANAVSTVIPQPAALPLAIMGLGAFALRRRRRA